MKQSPAIGLNTVGSPAPTSIIYDKPVSLQDPLRIQAGSIACLIIERQLRRITCCLFTLWFG